jgi:hypothetical protein
LQIPDSVCISNSFNSPTTRPSIAVDFDPELFSDIEYELLKTMDEIVFFSSYKAMNGQMGYVMDCGNDCIGAAKIISKILVDVKKIGKGTKLFCFSEPGWKIDDLKNWVSTITDDEIKSFLQNRINTAISNQQEVDTVEDEEVTDGNDLTDTQWITLVKILGVVVCVVLAIILFVGGCLGYIDSSITNAP